VAGAIVGGRLASSMLESGSHSRYAPLIALGGGLLLIILFQALGLRIGLELRSEVLRIPPLRSLDTAGGFLLGAATGLFLAWAVGVVALQLPGQTSLRREVQRSYVLKQLNSLLPPSSLLQALARLDPFPAELPLELGGSAAGDHAPVVDHHDLAGHQRRRHHSSSVRSCSTKHSVPWHVTPSITAPPRRASVIVQRTNHGERIVLTLVIVCSRRGSAHVQAQGLSLTMVPGRRSSMALIMGRTSSPGTRRAQ